MDPFTQYTITTNAPYITTRFVQDVQSGQPAADDIGLQSTGLYVDDVAQSDRAYTTINGGPVDHVWKLPGDGASHTLRLVDGPNAHITLGGVRRGMPTIAFRVPSGYSASVVAPGAVSKRVIVWGTSITVGSRVTTAPLLSPAYQSTWMLARQHMAASNTGTYAGAHVTVSGASQERYFDIADSGVSAATITHILAQCTGTTKNTVIFDGYELNDWGASTQTAAAFGTMIGTFFDALKTAADGASIPGFSAIAITAITSLNESTPNSQGATLPNMRTQVANAVSARSTWMTKIDGPPLVTFPGNYAADSVHPNTAGQSEKEVNVRAALTY